jgi:hypothetical protein
MRGVVSRQGAADKLNIKLSANTLSKNTLSNNIGHFRSGDQALMDLDAVQFGKAACVCG